MAEVTIYDGGALVSGTVPPRRVEDGLLLTNNVDSIWALGFSSDVAIETTPAGLAAAPNWELSLSDGAYQARVQMSSSGAAPLQSIYHAAFGYDEDAQPVILLGVAQLTTVDGGVSYSMGGSVVVTTPVIGVITSTMALQFVDGFLVLRDVVGSALATISPAMVNAQISAVSSAAVYSWASSYPAAAMCALGVPTTGTLADPANGLSGMVSFKYDFAGDGPPPAFWQNLVGCVEVL